MELSLYTHEFYVICTSSLKVDCGLKVSILPIATDMESLGCRIKLRNQGDRQ